MSSDNRGSSNPVPSTQQRRGSIPPGTSPATSLFQRRNSLAVSMAPPAIFSTPTTAGESNHRRRMSVSASLGLAGSAGGAFDYRRSSTSTTTDSIGESAVEDDDRNPSALPFARRMSVQPARSSIGSGGAVSAGGSPNTGNDPSFLVPSPNAPVVGGANGSATPAGGPRPAARRHSISAAVGAGNGPPFRRGSTSTTTTGSSGFLRFDGSNDRSRPPVAAIPTGARHRRGSNSGVGSVDTPMFTTYSNAFANRNQDQSFYDWGAHLRARAQSSVNTTRPVFGTSPPREPAPQPAAVPRATELPRPPVQPAPPKPQRAKPDAYQERILKGDFYMD
jgi:hypothetical protein